MIYRAWPQSLFLYILSRYRSYRLYCNFKKPCNTCSSLFNEFCNWPVLSYKLATIKNFMYELCLDAKLKMLHWNCQRRVTLAVFILDELCKKKPSFLMFELNSTKTLWTNFPWTQNWRSHLILKFSELCGSCYLHFCAQCRLFAYSLLFNVR